MTSQAPPQQSTLIASPGPEPGTVKTEDGQILRPPASWALLPPGDATLTRRVKKEGPSWTVQKRRGRKVFSEGVWAPAEIIEQVRQTLEAERSTPAYQRRLKQQQDRRHKAQEDYVLSFRQALIDFLAFHPRYAALAERLADAVTEHATPVGSGTVARTKRISLERKVEAAVIAWMRHQTTGYDNLRIARVKGRRREVRRKLAEQSRRLLNAYRKGASVEPDSCPLQEVLMEDY